MSWGSELWDKYPELSSHSANGIDFLDHSVASFVKERGKIEAEYAARLRSLVKKYSPNHKAESVRKPNPEDEFTHFRAYKQVRRIIMQLVLKCSDQSNYRRYELALLRKAYTHALALFVCQREREREREIRAMPPPCSLYKMYVHVVSMGCVLLERGTHITRKPLLPPPKLLLQCS